MEDGGNASGRYDALLATLLEAVLRNPSTLDPKAREAAAAGDPSAPYFAYALKVRDASYKVMDEDVDKLKAAGLSEEQIFELTVSAALGSARERLTRALAATRGGA